MDVDSERIVQQRLGPVTRDKTLILITHRLSMLRIVNRLIVMDGGKIILDGPRDAVLSSLQERQSGKSRAGNVKKEKVEPAAPGKKGENGQGGTQKTVQP